MVKMAGMVIHWKGSNFSKLSTVVGCNHYLCTLIWLLEKVQSKLSHTCSSYLNYFRKINIKLFKCVNSVESETIFNTWVLSIKYGLLCVKIIWLPFCIIFFCTCFTKKTFLPLQKRKKIFLKVISKLSLAPLFPYQDTPMFRI